MGCVHLPEKPASSEVDPLVAPPATILPRRPATTAGRRCGRPPRRFGPLSGPQPVDVFIRRALAENRTVQAAYHNVQSLKERIPQVTALDDPVASNAVFPIPERGTSVLLDGLQPL